MNRRTTGLLMGVVLAAASALHGSSPAPAAEEKQPAATNPFLETLVKTEGGVTIAYGTGQRSEEAAMLIFQAARAISSAEKSVKIMKAAEFDASHFRFTGTTHVIAVGTLADSAVLQGRNWLPTWWLDRDWYCNEYKYAVQPEKALPYQPKSGFVVAGFGEWPKGDERIGYVEVDRSEYFMEWMVRGRYEEAAGGPIRNGNHPKWWDLNKVSSPTYPADFPLRLMVRITGSGGAGVMAAAKAFLENRMLGGAVLAEGANVDAGPVMFTLPAARYAKELPLAPPAGADGCTYQGWLLPSAYEYDGFCRDAGVAPRIMYRLKYKPAAGITNFWTTPHRRASQFEVCVAYFAGADEAEKARKALEQTLANTPGGKEGKIKGFNMAASGSVLILESLPEPAGKSILDLYLRLNLQ